jgi:parvulin-like peptidyl-prolyl isomerase
LNYPQESSAITYLLTVYGEAVMSRKDAGATPNNRRRWAFRISILVLFVSVVGASIAARCLWGLGRANADSPSARTPAGTAQGATRAPAARAVRVDPRTLKTMAIVNGEEITRQQLAQATLVRYGEQVLEGLVNKHLILQACNASGIVITDKDIDIEIESICKKFGLPRDQWQELLQSERDVNEQEYRRDIIWPTLALRRLAANRLTISDEELQKAWQAEHGAKVQVSMITAKTQEKAEQLRAKALANPDEFGKLAKDESADRNSRATRGMIPPIRRHVGDPEIERVAFALNPGEISQVVHAANQYFVFKCERHVPPTRVDPTHVRAETVRIRDRIIDGKLRQAAAEIFKKLQDEAKDQIVNVYNDPQLRAKSPGVAAIINGRQLTVRELAEECILRHGLEVLDSEINRLLLAQEQRRRKITVAEEDLDAEIARAADSFGHLKPDGSPDIESWLGEVTQQENVTVDIYIQDAVWPSATLKKLVRSKVQVTEDDKRKGFDANYGERVEVLAIVCGSQRRAIEVHEMADANPNNTFFGDLAHEYSIEPVSKANYGQVPPVQRFGGQPLIEKEAFALAAGELSGVIAVGDKYIVLKCLGRTKPLVRQRDEVEAELTKDIFEKKLRIAMSDEFDRLRDRSHIENFLAGTSHDGRQSKSVQPASMVVPATPYGASIRKATRTSPTSSAGTRR